MYSRSQMCSNMHQNKIPAPCEYSTSIFDIFTVQCKISNGGSHHGYDFEREIIKQSE